MSEILTPEERDSFQWEIVNGKKIPMRYHTVKLSSEEIAFICLIMSEKAIFKFGRSFSQHDLYVVDNIMKALDVLGGG